MTEPTIADRLHDGMHRLPGMPDHSEAAERNDGQGHPNRSFQSRTRRAAHTHRGHEHGQPRVLVRWQTAIARLFS
ncbi:hypothetical protein [Microbacterium terricola]|uniref:Uncharacterized protein n=1 Tax=Microbacterium terricola TaxID=344163 RepID=A0ABM8DVV0_9MICO|nr:hypothetical protein [Microbacterium terricola]UYK39671.1 hypothetical protein OAU46_13355 [Microbacterium terricola]BDV29586.1 hypothetical protein Microterr_02460 [Microbacterium terricola]